VAVLGLRERGMRTVKGFPARLNVIDTIVPALLKRESMSLKYEPASEPSLTRSSPPCTDRCSSQSESNYFTEMCSGSEAGSYVRRGDFVHHSTLGLRVIKKKRRSSPPWSNESELMTSDRQLKTSREGSK